MKNHTGTLFAYPTFSVTLGGSAPFSLKISSITYSSITGLTRRSESFFIRDFVLSSEV